MMITIAEIESKMVRHLRAIYPEQEARSLTGLVLAQVLQVKTRSQLLIKKQELLSQADQRQIDQILQELKTGKPLQYVLGETEFYGLSLAVNPSVLIPRPETEELVAWILKTIDHSRSQKVKLLDIGTGSGCIAIALKKKLPSSSLCALDLSLDALETAAHNAKLNDVNIEFFHDDILHPRLQYTSFDLIVSNPPYVSVSEKRYMHSNVKDHEPHRALFVPDTDPLLFYKAIANFAASHLNEQGLLFFEINEKFGKVTADLLDQKGFCEIELKKDLKGKDRMLKAIYRA